MSEAEGAVQETTCLDPTAPPITMLAGQVMMGATVNTYSVRKSMVEENKKLSQIQITINTSKDADRISTLRCSRCAKLIAIGTRVADSCLGCVVDVGGAVVGCGKETKSQRKKQTPTTIAIGLTEAKELACRA